MDINWLRDLVEVGGHASFSRAAKARNTSLSSLSRRIQQLEEWAGRLLVDRASHPIDLTPAGRTLLPVAQSVLLEIDRVRGQLRGSGNQREPVTFLSPNAVSVGLFPRLLGMLQSSLGALPINLVPDNFREVTRRFREGDADFALYYVCDEYSSGVPLNNLESALIAHDALIPVARDAQAAEGARAGVVRGAFLDEASYLGQVAHKAMVRHHVEYETNIAGSQILAIRQLAIEGAGLAWLPASLVSEDIRSRRLHRMLPHIAPIAISIQVVRRTAACSATVEQVWSQLRDFSRDGRVMRFDSSVS